MLLNCSHGGIRLSDCDLYEEVEVVCDAPVPGSYICMYACMHACTYVLYVLYVIAISYVCIVCMYVCTVYCT